MQSLHCRPAADEPKDMNTVIAESKEKKPVLLCIKVKDEALETDRRPAIITKLGKKVAKLGRRKHAMMRSKNGEEEGGVANVDVESGGTTEGGVANVDVESGSSDISEERNAEAEQFDGSTSGNLTAQEKLANAERKLAKEIMLKKEKRQRYKMIIEENEDQLEVLSKQMQDVEEDIKNKEAKITEMKLERKEKPLLKKFSSQYNIAKSVLKKERLEDDLSVLKNQSASRRRIIQKYKTKIRYDLQILNDPSITAVKPSQEKPKPKHAPRPIPQCFFVGAPRNQSTQQDTVPLLEKSPITASQLSVSGERLSSLWSLSSVDDEANSLLVRRIESERDDRVLSREFCRRYPSTELGRGGDGCLSPSNVVSGGDVVSDACAD